MKSSFILILFEPKIIWKLQNFEIPIYILLFIQSIYKIVDDWKIWKETNVEFEMNLLAMCLTILSKTKKIQLKNDYWYSCSVYKIAFISIKQKKTKLPHFIWVYIINFVFTYLNKRHPTTIDITFNEQLLKEATASGWTRNCLSQKLWSNLFLFKKMKRLDFNIERIVTS